MTSRTELDALLLHLGPPPPARKGPWLRTGLARAVDGGVVPPGSLLPGSRVLAGALGLARGTVVEVLDQLVAEGRLDAVPRVGVRVPARLVSGRVPRPVPVPRTGPPSPGVPDTTAFPRRAWSRAVRTAVDRVPAGELGYPDPAGHPRLREVLAAYLARTRGARADPERLVVTSGMAQALALLARISARSGLAGWAAEAPGSPGTIAQLQANGVTVHDVPVDAAGLRVDAVPAHVSAVLVTPAHQFPTGVVLGPERRRALVERARALGWLVVEDDYDGDLRLDRTRVGVLQGAAPEDVVLLGTVSKSLAPALRLGWAVAPVGWRDALVAERLASDLGTPVVDQLALAELVASGAYDQHLRRVRRTYRARRAALVAALTRAGVDVPDAAEAGLHLFLPVPSADAAVEVARRVSDAGAPSAASLPADGSAGVVVGYAALPEPRAAAVAAAVARALAHPVNGGGGGRGG